MIDLICKNCKNKIYFELKGKKPHIGIYCKICGNWIKWANKDEIKKLNKDNDIIKNKRYIDTNELYNKLRGRISVRQLEIIKELINECDIITVESEDE